MSDLEIKNRISEKAREYFFKFGFSRVTMNEIATELGMSKKTLYTYFQSKEDLLHASIAQMHLETSRKIEDLVSDSTLDFGEKLNKLLAVFLAHHSALDARFLADLQKNVPGTWKFCDDFQRDRMRANTSAILREGIEKGVIRSDVDEDFLVQLFSVSIQNMMKPEILSQIPLTPSQIFEKTMKVFFRGILTEDGRAKYFSRGQAELTSEHQMD